MTKLLEIPLKTDYQYFASEDGKIYRWTGKGLVHVKGWKHLSKKKGNYYWRVALIIGGKRKMFYTHRLICFTFKGEPPVGKNQVRHLDGDSLNPAANNTEWGDWHENNVEDKVRHGTYYRDKKDKIPVNEVEPESNGEKDEGAFNDDLPF